MHIKVTNGNQIEYPYSIGKLRRDNPNTSFPKIVSDETLNEWNVYKVNVLDAPSINDRTQRVEQEAQPYQENGQWILGWSVIDKTAEEIQQYDDNMAMDNRGIRDLRIAETDWWASSDLTMTAEQTAYRQALRDITSHANWPHLSEDDWPTKP